MKTTAQLISRYAMAARVPDLPRGHYMVIADDDASCTTYPVYWYAGAGQWFDDDDRPVDSIYDPSRDVWISINEAAFYQEVEE